MIGQQHCSFHEQRRRLNNLIKQIKRWSWKQLKHLQDKLWPPCKVAERILKGQGVCQNCSRLHKKPIDYIHAMLQRLLFKGLIGYQLGTQQYINETCDAALGELESTANTRCLAQ